MANINHEAGVPLLSMAVSLLQLESVVDTKLMVKASRDLISRSTALLLLRFRAVCLL